MFPSRSPGRLTRPQSPPSHTPTQEDFFDTAFAAAATATAPASPFENTTPLNSTTLQRRRTTSAVSAKSQRAFDTSSLTPEERFAYGQYFKKADVLGAGVLSGQHAVTFLSKSKLNQNVLGDIWNLADADGQGSLTPLKFAVALKLIAAAQQGEIPTLSALWQETPLPIFEGVRIEPYNPPPTGTGTGTNAASNYTNEFADVSGRPTTPDISNHVSPISAEEQQRFAKKFFENSPVNGYLDGEKVKTIFMKSKLPIEALGQIWNLANPKKAGFIDASEFCIAMHLIQGMMNGSIRSLPSALPPNILPASIPSTSPQPLSPPIPYVPGFGGAAPSPIPGATTTSAARANVGSNIPTTDSNTTGASYSPVTRHKTGGPISNDPSLSGFAATSRHASGLAPSGVVRHMTGPSTFSRSPSNLFHNGEEEGVWEVTQEQREKFDRYFQGLDIDKKGYITGEEGVKFFTNSKLAPTTLGQIWELADRRKAGRLSREEFAIAMHLIQKCLTGVPLPPSLPASLAATLKGPSQSSVTSGTRPSSRMSFGVTQDFPQSPATSAIKSPSFFGETPPPQSRTATFQDETAADLMRGIEDAQKETAAFVAQTPELIAKRNAIESNIAMLHIQRQDLNARLTQAKESYEKEAQSLQEAEQNYASQEQEISSLRKETEQAERTLAELQIEKEGVCDQWRSEEEAASAMKRKLAQLNEEAAELRSEIERMEKDLMTMKESAESTRKQLASVESVRDDLAAEKSRLSDALIKSRAISNEASISSNLHASTAASSLTGGGQSDPFGNSSSFDNVPAGAFGDAWNTLSDQTRNKTQPSFASAFDLQPKIHTSALPVGGTPGLTSAPAQLNKKENDAQDDDSFSSNSPRRPATGDSAAHHRVDVNDFFADFAPSAKFGPVSSVPPSTKAPFQETQQASPTSEPVPPSTMTGPSFVGFQSAPGDFNDNPTNSVSSEPIPSGSSGKQGVFLDDFETAFGSSFTGPNRQSATSVPGSPGKPPGALTDAFESSPFSTSPAKSTHSGSGMEGFESRFPALEDAESGFGFDDHFGQMQEKPPTSATQQQPPIARTSFSSTQPAPFRSSSELPASERVVSSRASDRYSTTSEDLSFVSAPSQQSTGIFNADKAAKETTMPRTLSPAVSRDEFDAAFSELDGVPTTTTHGAGTSQVSNIVPELDSIFSTADFEFDPHFDNEEKKKKKKEDASVQKPEGAVKDFDSGISPKGRPPTDSGAPPPSSSFPAFFDDAFFPSGNASAQAGSDLDAAFGGFREPNVEPRSSSFGPFGSDPFGREPSQPFVSSTNGGGTFSFEEAFGKGPSEAFGGVQRVNSGALDEAEDVESVKNLMALGFDREQVLAALEEFGYDETRATNHLLEAAAGK